MTTTTSKAGHSAKVANVFGFGVDEDDDNSDLRDLELARNKRARLSASLKEVDGLSKEGPPSSAPAKGRPVDMCTQLMKMAEWKRQCAGKRLPMPKDLEDQVAKAMGGGQR